MNKVLIVDDHADIRRLIRMTLEFEACELAECAESEACLDMARQWQPDIVLLDVMMPGPIDGIQACRHLKRHPPGGKVPKVVLLTARGRGEDREAGLAAGADAYLVKPFSPLQLLETVAALAPPIR